jgi:hypothetical protein
MSSAMQSAGKQMAHTPQKKVQTNRWLIPHQKKEQANRWLTQHKNSASKQMAHTTP